jgi:hypothetical protein
MTGSAGGDGVPMLKEITINVKARGEHFTVGALIRALERTLDVLRGMEVKMASGQPVRDWQVASLNANGELRMTVKGDMPESLVTTYLRGMRTLDTTATAPAEFDDEDLSNARRLVGLLERDAESITFASPGEEPVSPTQHVAANVDAILRKRYRYTYATLEGMLETLNVHGGNAFTIYDVLTDHKTVCEFPEDLYAKAYAAVRKRVLVTGRIKYNRDGDPVSMTVETIRERRPAEALPQIRAGEEIDLTGGMDSAEYVRGMRDAE